MKKNTIVLACALFLLFTAGKTHADSGFMGGVGSNPMPQNSKDIIMDDEIINLNVYEDWHEAKIVYNFRNTGKAQTVIMGFPDSIDRKKDALMYFRSFINGKEVTVKTEKRNYDNSAGFEMYNQWYLFEVPFASGETVQIINTYSARNSINMMESRQETYSSTKQLTYVVRTGATWKDAIGKLDVQVNLLGVSTKNFNNFTTPLQQETLDGMVRLSGLGAFPAGYTVDEKNQRLQWHMENVEPDFDFEFNFMPWDSVEGKISYQKGTEYYKSPIKSTSASSALTEVVDTVPSHYIAAGVVDSTASYLPWCEGAKGNGVGEELTIAFEKPTTIEQLAIKNGFSLGWGVGATSEDKFLKNGRVKTATLTFSDGSTQTISLKDTQENQYVTILPVTTTSFSLKIQDVYAGNTYEDTCLRHIEFLEKPYWFSTFHDEAEWVSQTRGIWGDSGAFVLKPGEKQQITAKFRNVGLTTWKNTGDKRMGFYVYKDQIYSTPPEYSNPKNALFGKSFFAGPGWSSSFDGKVEDACAATLEESTVQPGKIGTFVFTFTPPANAKPNPNSDLASTPYRDDFYREDLSLAIGPDWIHNSTNGDPISVAHVWFPIRVEE